MAYITALVGATQVAMIYGMPQRKTRTVLDRHPSGFQQTNVSSSLDPAPSFDGCLRLTAKAFRPLRGRFISFAGPKETNQRKGPSPTKHICQANTAGMFRLANPWLGRNTTHILVRRPSGLGA